MLNIIIVDDHLPTLKRFTNYFNKQFNYCVIDQFQTAYDFIVKLNTTKQIPNIILVDINMPIMDGVALTYYIKICFQDIIVIGLSVYSDENSLLDILLSGADGYVIKAQAENFLLEAIQAVMRNEVYIDNRIDTNKQLIKSMFLNHSNDKYTNIFGITQREKIFLTLNATTFSYKEIAELMFIEIKTVQTYYDRIAKKMNTNSRLGLTLCSLQYGYARIANFKQYNTTDT